MSTAIALAVPITLIFAALGLAKVLGVAPMRQLAAEAGFSTDAYRRIGVLEVAGAAGVAIGIALPVLGRLAAAGLLLLLAGALVTHIRKGDSPRKYALALVCALLVVGYLVALAGVAR